MRRLAAQALPWRERKDEVAWRGSAGGQWLRQPDAQQRPMMFDWLPRLHLCAAARASRHACKLDIGMSSLRQIEDPDLVAVIVAAGLSRPEINKADFFHDKYQVDIDGWAFSHTDRCAAISANAQALAAHIQLVPALADAEQAIFLCLEPV